jgi:hypothetical protein
MTDFRWSRNLARLIGLTQTEKEGINMTEENNSQDDNNSNEPEGGGGDDGNNPAGNNPGTSSPDSGDGGGNDPDANNPFNGEFDANRARKLIDTLRDERKAAAKRAKELEAELERLRNGTSSGGDSGGNDGSDDAKPDPATLALKEVEKLRKQMQAQTLRQSFEQVSEAMNMRPEVRDLAFNAVRQQIEMDDTGTPTNLTTLVEGMRQQVGASMFIPQAKGQQGRGTAGGHAAGTAPPGSPLTDAQAKLAEQSGLTPEEYLYLQDHGRPMPKKAT